MARRAVAVPKFRVVCPDWRSKPMTRDAAERWLAEVERVGACMYGHELVEEVVSPPGNGG